MIFGLFNKRKANFEKSCELSALATSEVLNGDLDNKALELYQRAILACPKNPLPYWNVIACLHNKKRDVEAFDLFEKVQKLDYQIILSEFKDNKWLTLAMPDLVVVRPSIIGMFIVLGKIDLARAMFIQELKRCQGDERKFDRNSFASGLGFETFRLSINDSKKLINLVTETALEGYLSDERWKLIESECINWMGLKIRYLLKENKFYEALEGVNFIAGNVITYSQFISIDELLKLQKSIPEEIEETKKWDLKRSDDEFFVFLFKRLAFRFHPDLGVNEDDRTERTKIMPKINQAYSENSLIKLEEIVRKHIPEWSKYLQQRK